MRPGTALPPAFAKRMRAMLMGLGTATGLAKRGFFLPYRYAGSLTNGQSSAEYNALRPEFVAAQPRIRQVLAAIEEYAQGLAAFGKYPPPAPRWTQGWFPRLDAAAAYAIVRSMAPRRIVEVGSGHSTRFLAAAAADSGLETAIFAIDPNPRASIEGLPVEILRNVVQNVAIERFKLASGDILFVDSSHLLMPGSDVDFLINRVWPILPKGTLVHFHDVFLPDGYPPAWDWRGYNEQLAIAPLIASGSAEIIFSSHYTLTRMGEELAGTAVAQLPLAEGAVETSLWLRKRASPPAGDPY